MTFSITIPSYKARFLHEAIQSVTNQTYRDWELIIVDDCSPEDLFSITKPFLVDKRIHYYRNKKNCGSKNVVENWNICLGYCTGDYVLCMGDDDRLRPNCLEEYIKLMEIYPHLNVYHARTQIINENGDVIDSQETRPQYETCAEMLFRQWAIPGKQFLGDFLFSRQWLNTNGGYIKFPYGLSSDRTTANLAAKEGGIANGQEITFEYRDSPITLSRSQNMRIAATSCNETVKWYIKHFEGILPKEFHGYFVSKISDMIYLDVTQEPLTGFCYWLSHTRGLLITFPQVLKACVRGIASSCKVNLKNAIHD